MQRNGSKLNHLPYSSKRIICAQYECQSLMQFILRKEFSYICKHKTIHLPLHTHIPNEIYQSTMLSTNFLKLFFCFPWFEEFCLFVCLFSFLFFGKCMRIFCLSLNKIGFALKRIRWYIHVVFAMAPNEHTRIPVKSALALFVRYHE